MGWRVVCDGDALDRWRARAHFVAGLGVDFPEPSDARLYELLADACAHATSFAELRALGLERLLPHSLPPAQQALLRRHAPEQVTLQNGQALTVQYSENKPPGIASYLQDFFGTADGPRVGHDVPLVLELWAPNGRAVQVTRDLAGFWARHYPDLRRSLCRRYPKHCWPEDPLAAPAVRLKRHMPSTSG